MASPNNAVQPPINKRPLRPEQFWQVMPDGRYAFWIDNSLLNSFNSCEELFRYRHIENKQPKGVRVVLSIGSWWSRTMELFYNILATKGMTTSLADMLTCTAMAWRDLNMESLRASTDDKVQKRMTKFKWQDGAIVMASRYYETYAEHDARNWQIIAAELGFGHFGEVPLGETDKVVVYWCGKPDLIVYEKATDSLVPLDHKTVEYVEKHVNSKYKPFPQIAGYVHALNILAKNLGITRRAVDRCIVNVAARNEPKDPKAGEKVKPRFTRVYPNYSQSELEEWRVNTLRKAERLRFALEHNEWIWRESTCHLYGGCEFRGVCSVVPSSRPIVIQANYQDREPWVPYTVEEDEE